MKVIGLLGGMSWESSQIYYRALNEAIKQRLGGLHSAEMVLYSIDFARLEVLQQAKNWGAAADLLIDAARKIENAGADFLLIGTNTMHIVAEQVANAIDIPLLHIADAVGERIAKQNIDNVALLGTAFTMTEAFYRVRLQENFGLNVMTPSQSERDIIHRVIYEELCQGVVSDDARRAYLNIIDNLSQKGAQGVILGCTEIGLLVKQEHSPLPLFDTVESHVEKAVEFALERDVTSA
ncbi:aspartate/glutamate racemase family protein [Alteromonas sp. a30]|uniref:aspartate/glutamate racemase family protein n=1 Tax=Alteromonas sp. a30 TaxID=2730917 RepID=UPI00227E367B|nr:aspartate/glutamate racemase family protein [Alteromonas sp. a30]MCY7294290.1 aspartate/glutamate racemase family protein [Alteromonas sp. a30]